MSPTSKLKRNFGGQKFDVDREVGKVVARMLTT
jgi:hypothetical protein